MKKNDKILITNDDGYYAKGIKVLKKVLNKYVDEVYTVAPSKNQSGSGRSITLGSSINYTKVSKFDWVIDGTPVDAMIFALNNLFKNDKPDYIFSGINSGSNIGDEISYSGTVGAAFEGALRGVRSLAISQSGSFNDINKFIVASENPINLKPTSLQFGKFSLKELTNSSLSIIFRLFAVQPENSGKRLFSIPEW